MNMRLINTCSGCAFDSAVAGPWQVCRLAQPHVGATLQVTQ